MTKYLIGEYYSRIPPRTNSSLAGLFLGSRNSIDELLLFPGKIDYSGKLQFPSEIFDTLNLSKIFDTLKNELFIEIYKGPEREFFNIYSGELVTLKPGINDNWLQKLKKK